MNIEILKAAAELATKVGYILVATADAKGWPHVAAAGRLALGTNGHVSVSEWFCPRTMANLRANSRLTLVVWDAAVDNGYQLLGELEETKDVSMLDGYSPGREGKVTIPQVERRLLVHIDRIMEFKRAPHSDAEE